MVKQYGRLIAAYIISVPPSHYSPIEVHQPLLPLRERAFRPYLMKQIQAIAQQLFRFIQYFLITCQGNQVGVGGSIHLTADAQLASSNRHQGVTGGTRHQIDDFRTRFLQHTHQLFRFVVPDDELGIIPPIGKKHLAVSGRDQMDDAIKTSLQLENVFDVVSGSGCCHM